MEAILPAKQVKEEFYAAADDLGFDSFVARKYFLVMKESDLDVYQIIGDERVALLLYGWIKCNDYITELLKKSNKFTISSSFKIVATSLTQYTLSLWFSQEWNKCAQKRQESLLDTFSKGYLYLTQMSNLRVLNWDYILRLHTTPWNNDYINQFFDIKYVRPLALRESVDCIQAQATAEDITYVKTEGVLLILHRFIKLLDAGSMEAVKQISMCVIAAWNRIVESLSNSKRKKMIANMHPDEKQALIYICHIHLMTIYEMDNVQGFVIDNIINNIRFYHQSIQETSPKRINNAKELKHTSARFIATTCIYLNINCSEFFEAIIGKFDVCLSTLFGAICKAYISYILGNLLMEINNKNDEDIESNLEIFKRLVNNYVKEREQSELFILGEMRKKEWQKTSHNLNYTVNYETDFKSKICKGNRMSNISKCENSDEDEQDTTEIHDNHRRVDPVFQNLPNNLNILRYVYNILATRKYKGWHFAKLVLLCKIIGYELNEIEKWRYHPGLTTEFMLNLEINLSRYYADLAIIFQDHPFMEQEFWLTAFYLDPNNLYREAVSRCGMRNRKRINDELEKHKRTNTETNNSTETDLKFGLLSSTIDVNEIVNMVNHDAPVQDYEPLYRALRAFRLPEKIIKDLLTVIFVPRNSSFSWALDWNELRQRCRFLAKRAEHKRHLVELSMAEANDRLKFLKIDYDKYKNRPQLDYGSIERGYENVSSLTDLGESDDDFVDEEDFEDYEDYRARCAELNKQRAKIKQEQLDMLSSYAVGTRLTRARTAAAIASSTYKEISDEKDHDSSSSDSENEESNDSITPEHQDFFNNQEIALKLEPPTIEDEEAEECVETSQLTELLKERSAFCNSTSGFKSFLDVWDVNDTELKQVESETIATNEIDSVLSIFKKLGDLKRTVHTSTPSNSDLTNAEPKSHSDKMACKKKKRTKSTSKVNERKHSITLEPNPKEDKKLTGKNTLDNESNNGKAGKRKKVFEKEIDLCNKKLRKEEPSITLENKEKQNSEEALEQNSQTVDKTSFEEDSKLKEMEYTNIREVKNGKKMEVDEAMSAVNDDKILTKADQDKNSVAINDIVMTTVETNVLSNQEMENISVESITKGVETNVLPNNDNKEEKENISHINSPVDTILKLATPSSTNEKDFISASFISSNTSKQMIGEMDAQALEEIDLPNSLTDDKKEITLEEIETLNRTCTPSSENNCDNINAIASLKTDAKTENIQNVKSMTQKIVCEEHISEGSICKENITPKAQETLVQILTTFEKLPTNTKVDNIQSMCLNDNDMKENITISKESERLCNEEISTSISMSDENKSKETTYKGNEILEEETRIVETTERVSKQLGSEETTPTSTDVLEVQKSVVNDNFTQEKGIKLEQVTTEKENLKKVTMNKNIENCPILSKDIKNSIVGRNDNITTNAEVVNINFELNITDKTHNLTTDKVPKVLNTIEHRTGSTANDETINCIETVHHGDSVKNQKTANDAYSVTCTVNDNDTVYNENDTINDYDIVTGHGSGKDNNTVTDLVIVSSKETNSDQDSVNKSETANKEEIVNNISTVNVEETHKVDNGIINDDTIACDKDTIKNSAIINYKNTINDNDIVNDNITYNDHETIIDNNPDNIKSTDLDPADEINSPTNNQQLEISENEKLKDNQNQNQTENQSHRKQLISSRASKHKIVSTKNENINEILSDNAKPLNASTNQESMISNSEKPEQTKKLKESGESKNNSDVLTTPSDNHSNKERHKGKQKNIEANVKLITESDRIEILKRECLERQLKVNIPTISAATVLNLKLNNPKVVLKRLNYEKFLAEKQKNQIEKIIETERNKKTTNATTVEEPPLAMKRSRRTCAAIRFRPTSSSSTDSFEDQKRRTKSSRSKRPRTNSSTKSYATKKTLVVTPRSSSGLKLRITSNNTLQDVTRISLDNKMVPIINIPTSSSEEETDPLYLEEVEFVRCD